MAEVYQIPENGGNNGIPFSIPLGGNGFGGFGGGMNGIVDLFGLAIIASIFGWGNGGFGGGFGGGNGQAAFLSNQLNNDSGRELIMNAINSNGEASRSAIQNLATMLGQDYNTVFGAVQNVQASLAQIAAQQGMSTLQVVNAIQSGNCALGQQLAQCCCENRLLTTQQGYEAQIRTLEQTNQLGTQAAVPLAFPNNTPQNVSIVVDVNGRDIQVPDVPNNIEIASDKATGCVYSCSREAMLQEVDGMMQMSKKALEQVDYHKSVLTEGEKMLETLNPSYAEGKQQARTIKQLEERQAATDKKLDAILSAIKAMNSSKS